jgi:starch-binding outer membrane protein, SusD/RagB family
MNSVIAGAGASTTLIHQQQWLGEAYFLRALQYFYLTNIFGDVPLALTPGFTTNNSLSRSPQTAVYQQIVNDLEKAMTALDDTYHDGRGNGTTDHGRPNRRAAETLLARVYLYEGNWVDAEATASDVIGDPQYSLGNPLLTFQANSTESIWQLAPVPGGGVNDYLALVAGAPAILPAGDTSLIAGVSYLLSDSLVNAFEGGDARLKWVQTVSTSTAPIRTWRLAAKYNTDVPGVEYIMMSRLAELFLIRAEARSRQGNIAGGAADVNTIRQRAQLPPVMPGDTTALLATIAAENRIEFFCEEGHRFFDLRRTGMLDAVETADEAAKGSSWQSYKQYWPIPPAEIEADPHLTQTPGY